MSKTGAIRQGRAFVELFTDDTQLTRGLRRAETAVEKFGANVSKIGSKLMMAGTAMAAPFVAGAAAFVKVGGALKEMSDRTGVAVETLSALQYAASQTGTSIEALEKGLRLSQKLIGSDAGAKTLERLGLSAEKLRGLAPAEQFMALADALAKIPDPAGRTAAAMQLFGRAGAELIPLMSGGSAGIAKLTDEARRLGLIMSTEDATAADHLEDSMRRVRLQMAHSSAVIGAALAPALEGLAKWLSVVIPKIKEFLEKNSDLIVKAAALSGAIIAAGAVLWALGKAFSGVGLAIGLVRQAMVILTPQGFALVVGIGAIAAATAYLTGAFKGMGQVFGQVWGGMRDAIEAGDIGLAMKIMWAGVVITWLEAKNYLIDLGESLLAGLLSAVVFSGGMILVAFAAVCQGIAWAWTEAWSGIRNGWTETRGWILKQWAELRGIFDAGVDVDAEFRRIDAETNSTTAQRRAGTDASHEKWASRTEGALQMVEDALQEISDQNAADMGRRAADVDAAKMELAQLRAEAARQKEASAAGWTMPGMRAPGLPDISSSVEKANSVVGAFDIGAILSLQAGDRGNDQKRIADNSERTANAVEEILAGGGSLWGN